MQVRILQVWADVFYRAIHILLEQLCSIDVLAFLLVHCVYLCTICIHWKSCSHPNQYSYLQLHPRHNYRWNHDGIVYWVYLFYGCRHVGSLCYSVMRKVLKIENKSLSSLYGCYEFLCDELKCKLSQLSRWIRRTEYSFFQFHALV